MKIYTKKGDAGETGLYGNVRVPKDDLRIRAYGTLDELNSLLGVALAEKELPVLLQKSLRVVQNELFQTGAELATPRGKDSGMQGIEEASILALEKQIDEMEAQLAPLKTFVLPGGAKTSAYLHLARTVCRRAEREMITLNRAEPLRPTLLQYMNRLSDHLFVAARFCNLETNTDDIPWIAPQKKS